MLAGKPAGRSGLPMRSRGRIHALAQVDEHVVEGVDRISPKRGNSRSRMTYAATATAAAKPHGKTARVHPAARAADGHTGGRGAAQSPAAPASQPAGRGRSASSTASRSLISSFSRPGVFRSIVSGFRYRRDSSVATSDRQLGSRGKGTAYDRIEPDGGPAVSGLHRPQCARGAPASVSLRRSSGV